MQGRIKINRNVDMYGMTSLTVDTPTSVKPVKKDKTKVKYSPKQPSPTCLKKACLRTSILKILS